MWVKVKLDAAELDTLLAVTDPVVWESISTDPGLIESCKKFQAKFRYYLEDLIDDAIESSLS